MRKENIFIASSAEMNPERLEIIDLLADMSIYDTWYHPVIWESMPSDMHAERKEDEYLRRLHQCEVCITMFWKTLGKYTKEELLDAINGQKNNHLPGRNFIIIKATECPSSELKTFLEEIQKEYTEIIYSFTSNKELRTLVEKLLREADVDGAMESLDVPNLKEIPIMIAADEELHEEKISFTELIHNLNEVLEPRGLRLRRIKWTPGESDEYFQILSKSEMCLNLYWKQLPATADQELKIAYEATCVGNNPHHLYIFFKEPSENITADLADFKAGFETQYGHFYCRFENVDTMNLHFLLQFEFSQNKKGEQMVSVEDGTIKFCGRDIVDLDKVPFAGLNTEYRQLQTKVKELEKELVNARSLYKENPDNDELLDNLASVRAHLTKAREEYNRYQKFLLNKELEFLLFSNEEITDNMRHAKELFEHGDAEGAARIMCVEDLLLAKEENDKLFDAHLTHRTLEIKQLKDAAGYALVNPCTTAQERYSSACIAYEAALDIAEKINYDNENKADLLFSYADIQCDYNHKKEAVSNYQLSLKLLRQLVVSNPGVCQTKMVMTLNNLASLLEDMNSFNQAEQYYDEALIECRALYNTDNDKYRDMLVTVLNSFAVLKERNCQYENAATLFDEALHLIKESVIDNSHEVLSQKSGILHNIAYLYYKTDKYNESERYYLDALKIRKYLAGVDKNSYQHFLAQSLDGLAVLKMAMHQYKEADSLNSEALEIYISLSNDNPDVFLPSYANAIENRSNLQSELPIFDYAEQYLIKALEIRERLAKQNPEIHIPHIARDLNNYGVLLVRMKRLDDAEKKYLDALRIRKELAKSNQKASLLDLAITLWNMAAMYQKMGECAKDKMKKCLDESIRIIKQMEDNSST